MRLTSAASTRYHNIKQGRFQCDCGWVCDALYLEPDDRPPPRAA